MKFTARTDVSLRKAKDAAFQQLILEKASWMLIVFMQKRRSCNKKMKRVTNLAKTW